MAKGIRRLLKDYIETVHGEELQEKLNTKKQSKIGIDYLQLDEYFTKENSSIINENALYQALESIETSYNTNKPFQEHISLKLINVPETHELHDLDATHNLEWISCKAMIKNITDIRVDLKEAVYTCTGCMKTIRVAMDNNTLSLPSVCPKCGGKKFELEKEDSIYRDYRLVKLEEPLELRKSGATREFKGYMQDYLASPYHNIKAGDVVDVTGLFKVEERKVRGRPDGFEFMIDIHNITPVDDAFEDYRLTEKDKEEILKLSQDENIFDILVNTLSPEVYGHRTVKEGLLLQLFEGGRPVDDSIKSGIMDRWTSHILIIGDPGIGKSQLITAVNKRAPKSIPTSGTNTSQAGLTTSAVKDELTGTWTMEAGGIILADTGLLIIDEFDKLSAKAQKSLNEPMEQLSVSSAKAGLVQTMSARTSVLAAANPKYSRFTDGKSLRDQLDIAESTLSRFDLIFVLKDIVSEDDDRQLARTLLKKDYVDSDLDVITDDCFKKYITYMKSNCFPVLTCDVIDRLTEFYVEVRQNAALEYDGKPITARDLKSLERMTIARAKCEGRNKTLLSDAEDAIRIYTESLRTLNLDLTKAGEVSGVLSDKELDIIEEFEKMVKAKIQFDGVPLPVESRDALKHELNVMCRDTSVDAKVVYRDVIRRVENDL